RDGAAASWRSRRHRSLLRRGLRLAGHFQHALHRACRDAAQRLSARRGGRDGGHAVLRGAAGDATGQDATDQEWRSTGPRVGLSMTAPSTSGTAAMDISIHASFLPQTDPDASLAFYRDILGFEVRNDVGYNGMRWITVGPPDQPDTSIVLYPPAASPGVTDDEKRILAEMMAKGTYAIMLLATGDLDAAFETAPCAIPPAICCACRTGAESFGDRDSMRDAILAPGEDAQDERRQP